MWGEAEQEAHTRTGFVHQCWGIWVQFLGGLEENSTKIGLSAYFKYLEKCLIFSNASSSAFFAFHLGNRKMKCIVSFSCFPAPSLPAYTQREDCAELCVLLWHYSCLSLAPQSFPGPVEGSAGGRHGAGGAHPACRP